MVTSSVKRILKVEKNPESAKNLLRSFKQEGRTELILTKCDSLCLFHSQVYGLNQSPLDSVLTQKIFISLKPFPMAA